MKSVGLILLRQVQSRGECHRPALLVLPMQFALGEMMAEGNGELSWCRSLSRLEENLFDVHFRDRISPFPASATRLKSVCQRALPRSLAEGEEMN